MAHVARHTRRRPVHAPNCARKRWPGPSPNRKD